MGRNEVLAARACLGAILAIDPLAGALAGVAVFLLYRWLQGSVQEVRWADSTRGFHASQVRSHLKQMGTQSDPGRDWRPCTVVFVPRDPDRRHRLITTASWLEGAAGFTTVARVVAGTGAMARKQAGRVEVELQRELVEHYDGVYGRVVSGDTVESGVSAMLQAHGLGAVRPNLAFYSWLDPEVSEENESGDDTTTYTTMVRTALRHGCNVAILHADDKSWERVLSQPAGFGKVAVWWSDDRTGQLLTMLAWMCTRSQEWSGADIEVWVAGDDVRAADIDRVSALLDDARLPAKVVGGAPPSAFVNRTRGASLVFAPMRLRHGEALGPDDSDLDEVGRQLPIVVFAQAVAPVELDVQPDEDGSAELAEARDRAQRMSNRAAALNEVAANLVVEAEVLRMQHPETDRAVVAADKAAAEAQRSYLDARTRADEAWRTVAVVDPAAAAGRVDPELWVNSATAERESTKPKPKSRWRGRFKR